jgi:heterodisulfide reductase subunit B
VNLSYYPGCSLQGSSSEYDITTRAVCDVLGIELTELDDWICCGASSGHSLDEVLHIALPAQNLKIAAEKDQDLLVPCAACYNRLKAALHAMETREEVREKMREVIDYDGRKSPAVLNVIELLQNKIGLDRLKNEIKIPLKGLKVACYYGCLLVRPPDVTCFDHPEHPHSMETVIEALGGESVRWSHTAECCGGSLSLVHGNIVRSLVDRIIESAQEAGAHAVVSLCPLCFENLDMRQTKKFPVFYLTELLGLALGINEFKHWIKKHFQDPTSLMETLRLTP